MNGIILPVPASEVKHLHPKILAFDVAFETVNKLREEGYNVSQGSLGTPYKVVRQAQYFPLLKNWNLPHDYIDHEIVLLDFNVDKANVKYKTAENIDRNVDGWWANHSEGIVDPRLLKCNQLQNDFDNILNYGGVFIIFVGSYYFQTFSWGYKDRLGNLTKNYNPTCSPWSFLTLTADDDILGIRSDSGSTMLLSEEIRRKDPFSKLLLKYLTNSKYYCTFDPRYDLKENWKGLIINKFGNDVGGIIMPDENRKGHIFIFPEINDKPSFLLEFINEILPEYASHLFPHHDKANWIKNPEYDLAKVKTLRREITEVRKDAKKKVRDLQNSISKENEKYFYLFSVLSETGTPLVHAVVETLQSIGFQKITDVDKELSKQGKIGHKREDLQIHDHEPTLIVEIKGINSMPSDADALEVQKYVPLRMKEWEKTNVKGLTIINMQRNIPPLERDNKSPFRSEILEAAEHQEVGLMTTYDLHRLVRSYHQNNWNHKDIYPLFYESGRISAIPTHYELIGTIERYIEQYQVVGVKIEHPGLTKDDLIAFELPLVFEEQKCESLQFERKDIEQAEVGMLVGIKTHLRKEQARTGIKVFRITNNL